MELTKTLMPVTPEGREELAAEIAILEALREEVAAELRAAAASAPAGQEPCVRDTGELAALEREIASLKETLGRTIVVNDDLVAAVGAEVSVIDDDGYESTYTFVGPVRANPRLGLVSFASDLAAVLGHCVGERVEVITPAGARSLTIAAIKRPRQDRR